MNFDHKLVEAKDFITGKQFAKALEILMEVLDDDPDNPGALFLFGSICIEQDKRGLAYNTYRRVASLVPDEPAAWVNFGRCQADDREGWEASLDCFKRALAINPKMHAALSNIATIYIQSCLPEEAQKWAEKCIEVKPDWDPGISALAFSQLMQGNWEEGWKNYEAMLGTSHRQDVEYGDIPLWDGTKGKTVIVYGEQGIGDEILFSSTLEDMAKDCTVVYDTMPRLQSLLQRSLPNVHVLGNRWENEIVMPKDVIPEARIPLAGVPVHYRKRREDFKGDPYLKACPEMRKAIRGLLDSDKPKIGIAWTGGTKRTRNQFRTFDLDSMVSVLRNKDVTFISLQYSDPTEEIENLQEKRGIKVHHFPWITEIKDYDLTAALVSELDLVISVPTSVTQLAGGLGVETWVTVPEITGWLFYREDYPWANSLKLYHDWTYKQIANDLEEWYANRTQETTRQVACR